MTVLIIAEKPNQAQAYANALKGAKKRKGYFEIPKNNIFPNGAIITYGIGHLITLKEPHEYDPSFKHWEMESLPIIPKSFEFKVLENKIEQFSIVKKLIHECDEYIVVATDSDREGESIADLIIKQAGGDSKPRKRLWINSLEDDEIVKGFKNLKDGKDFLLYAEEAQARQISDWLVGLNMSRLFTLQLAEKGVRGEGGKNIVFSVGRVQTPTLFLIYKRQKEIENFVSKPFYELEATFETENGTYKGKYKGKYDSKFEIEDVLKKYSIQLNGNIGLIKEVKKEIKQTKPPQLHSLSSLQILANKKYKYSPNKVLEIVQKLYDNPLKLVTYPRTDTPYITESEFLYLRENLNGYMNITKDQFDPYTLEASKRYVNSSKVQEHYAIIPTKKIPSQAVLDSLTKEEKNIYFEVIKSALGMFHFPYEYEETSITTEINQLPFTTKGRIEKSKGWKELFSNDPKDGSEEQSTNETILPNVIEGMNCNAKINVAEGKTTKPKPYTEGDLIPLMRDCGKKIKDMDVETKDILNDVEGLGTEATRSNIIETLKNQSYIEIKKNRVYVTKKGEILCQAVEGTLLAKPELTAKWESYLKKIGKNEGNKQTFIKNTITFTKNTVESTKKNMQSLDINSAIQEMQEIDHIALCPSCKKGYILDRKTFYGCSEYKNGCKQSFPKKKSGKILTKTQIKQLCEKGRTTSKVKGFKKKDGDDKFDAFLELKDGKIMFSFK